MNYQTASGLRKRSLSDLIAEKLLQTTTTIPTSEGGRPTTTKDYSIGGAIRSSIGEKLKASAAGLQEKFDPMNIARALTGGSPLAAALVGRMTGRKSESIDYFAGKGKKKRAGKKDPDYSSIGEGAGTKLRAGDSYADVLAKMFLYMQQAQEFEKLSYESEKNFREEQMAEDERRHKKMLAAILRKNKNKQTVETKTETSEPESIFSSILKIGESIFSFAGNLLSKIGDELSSFTNKVKNLLPFIAGIGAGGAAAALGAVGAGAVAVGAGVLIHQMLPEDAKKGDPVETKDFSLSKPISEMSPTEKMFVGRKKQSIEEWIQNSLENYRGPIMTNDQAYQIYKNYNIDVDPKLIAKKDEDIVGPSPVTPEDKKVDPKAFVKYLKTQPWTSKEGPVVSVPDKEVLPGQKDPRALVKAISGKTENVTPKDPFAAPNYDDVVKSYEEKLKTAKGKDRAELHKVVDSMKLQQKRIAIPPENKNIPKVEKVSQSSTTGTQVASVNNTNVIGNQNETFKTAESISSRNNDVAFNYATNKSVYV